MKKIGFIGLGIMGKPMSKNLLKAGYDLIVFDKIDAAVEEVVQAGAKKGLDVKDVAAQSDILITMLPNSPHVKSVVLGENGVLEGMKPGMILVDMSSIAPLASKEICAAVEEKGGEMIDAPVSGGEPMAISGKLSIMVGGKKEIFESVKDILLCMGATAVHCGDIGAGNTTKLANQIIVAANIAALSEALVFGKKAGVDPEAIFQAIRGGLAGSNVMNAKAPMMIEGNFKPGFRVELHIKDLSNVLETGSSVGACLPLTNKSMEIFQWLKANDMQSCDHSAMVQYFELLAGEKGLLSGGGEE